MEATGTDAAGERETITALFADIAGSTALSQDLDPEEARSPIDSVVALMTEAVPQLRRYECGQVARRRHPSAVRRDDCPRESCVGALFAAPRIFWCPARQTCSRLRPGE